MTTTVRAPEGDIAKRSLHFFWLVDYSGSMAGKKIAVLNQAVREAVGEVREAVKSHPEVQVFMRAIKFADTADWHVGPAPVPLEQFVWPELTTDGETATAQAIRLLASELTIEKMRRKGVPPVCLLLSDGHHTDAQEEYDGAIQELLKLPWAIKAVRLAIAIGENEADYDEKELLKFVSDKKVGLLKAHSPQELIKWIIWAGVTATLGVFLSKSKTGAGIGEDTNVILPMPDKTPVITSSTQGF